MNDPILSVYLKYQDSPAMKDGSIKTHSGEFVKDLWEAIETYVLRKDTDKTKCEHERKAIRPHYDHRECTSCGKIQADGDSSWGVASGKWFSNYVEAEFYRDHGKYPE